MSRRHADNLVSVYCDCGPERRTLTPMYETYNDQVKRRYRCRMCRFDLTIREERWTAFADRLAAAGQTELSIALAQKYIAADALR